MKNKNVLELKGDILELLAALSDAEKLQEIRDMIADLLQKDEKDLEENFPK